MFNRVGLFVTLMVSKPEHTYMSYLICQYLAKLAIELELLWKTCVRADKNKVLYYRFELTVWNLITLPVN